MSELRWSPPTRADDAEWAGLLAAIEAADGFGESYGPEELDAEWASVWAHPEMDSVFVWDGPELVAFGWNKTQIGSARGRRIDLWGGVHPTRRGEGIGTALLRWQVGRASAVAASLDGSPAASALMTLVDGQADRLHVASSAGFEPVRSFLEVARPTAEPVPTMPPVAGLRLEGWSATFDQAARAAHAAAFVDHWGSEPRSEEEWRQWYTGHRCFRPDLSALAVDGEGEVAAFVLTAAYPNDWEAGAAPVEAWINTVGTRRAWRGRGVGRWLLAHVLERVAACETRFERAILGVDAENPTGALRLYKGLGFAPVRTVTTLALEL